MNTQFAVLWMQHERIPTYTLKYIVFNNQNAFYLSYNFFFHSFCFVESGSNARVNENAPCANISMWQRQQQQQQRLCAIFNRWELIVCAFACVSFAISVNCNCQSCWCHFVAWYKWQNNNNTKFDAAQPKYTEYYWAICIQKIWFTIPCEDNNSSTHTHSQNSPTDFVKTFLLLPQLNSQFFFILSLDGTIKMHTFNVKHCKRNTQTPLLLWLYTHLCVQLSSELLLLLLLLF